MRKDEISAEVGEHLFLKVSSIQGVVRFRQKKGKFSSRYIGPFEILEYVGKVAYKISLPPRMPNGHNVFYISMLRKCIPDATHVIDFNNIKVSENVSYKVRPIRILDRSVNNLRKINTSL